MKVTDTLQRIHSKLDRLGDLPVFSATVNRINQVSNSQESDAMALAMAIMRDVSLSARLLRLANAPLFNRGQGNISHVSRAVVVLGFDRIRNLCVTLKLVEGFHQQQPDLNVPGMLMRAFLNANLASEFMQRGKHRGDAEAAYINGLLYGLGEIVVAYCLPDDYRRMQQHRAAKKHSWAHIQREVLGAELSDIGQELARSWGYPSSVAKAMREPDQGSHTPSEQVAGLGYHLLEQLYGFDERDEYPFAETMSELMDCTGLEESDINEVLVQGFRQAGQVAKDCGLQTRRMIPRFVDGAGDDKNELIRQLAFTTRMQLDADGPVNDSFSEMPQSGPPATDGNEHARHQLEALQEINEMIASNAPVQEILRKVVNALQQFTGFDRVIFCLLAPDAKAMSVRLGRGEHLKMLERYFNRRSNGGRDDLFFRLVERGANLLVADLDEEGWRERLPTNYLSLCRSQGFVASPLKSGKRTIGMIYADKLAGNQGISAGEFRTFNQFVSQVHFSLSHRARDVAKGPAG